MKKIIDRLKLNWISLLLTLWLAGGGKTARATGHWFSLESVGACDTVPAIDTFDFYISNHGSNVNSGKSSSAPKLSVDSVNTLMNTFAGSYQQASIGLEADSKFREQFNIGWDNITIGSFGLQNNSNKRAAQITGMDIVKDWKVTQGKNNVYESVINHTVELNSPNYNYLFVAEIDTLSEKSYPVSAVRYLTYVSTLAQCEALPGSFYTATLTQNPSTLYIHPTQGLPGNSGFRYEVVKRPYAINSFYYNNCRYENLFLQSSGNGYGMLGAGENTLVRNVGFQGGGTHHAVIKSGLVDHCLFLPGPKGFSDEISLVFYAPEGKGNRNAIRQTVFLDIKNPIFTHTNGTSNYRSITVDSVYAFADTLYAKTVTSGTNIDSVYISNTYCNGYKNFWIGLPPYLSVNNTVINAVSEPAFYFGSDNEMPCRAIVSNTLIKTNSNDANQHGYPTNQPPIGFLFVQKSTSLKVSNTIFHGQSSWHTQYTTGTVFENSIYNKLEAFNNIYICDVNQENNLHIMNANNASGKGTATNVVSDYNVYVLLKGRIYWTAYPFSPEGDGNIFSLTDWQSFTGQDQHSIFIDLRNNPAGLKAIFTDPENGNWTLTQTPQADSIRMLQAGMLTPPLYYPLRPTYEDALSQAPLGGLSYFTGNRELNHEVKLSWKTMLEPNLAYFGVESSSDKVIFKKVSTVPVLGKGRDNLYTELVPDTSYMKVYYRLRLMMPDSSFTFSSVISINPSKRDSIVNGIGSSSPNIILYPNPAGQSITVEHPARDRAEINIYDYAGKHLQTTKIAIKALTTVLLLRNLPAGKYILRWTSEREKKTVSFIKGSQ